MDWLLFLFALCAKHSGGAVSDWRLASPRGQVLPFAFPHPIRNKLPLCNRILQDPPRLRDEALRRILEHGSQCWAKPFVRGVLIACELKLDRCAGMHQHVALAIMIAWAALFCLCFLPYDLRDSWRFVESLKEFLWAGKEIRLQLDKGGPGR